MTAKALVSRPMPAWARAASCLSTQEDWPLPKAVKSNLYNI